MSLLRLKDVTLWVLTLVITCKNVLFALFSFLLLFGLGFVLYFYDAGIGPTCKARMAI